MGAVINEVGSTAGGIAKVEYKDEAGNVLWYYDDAGNFVRNGNAKITGLAGTGTRMVVTDSSGNLSSTKTVTQRVDSALITSTTFVNLGVTLPSLSVGSEIFIGFYNAANGSQGAAKYIRVAAPTSFVQIALTDGTGCGVSFQMSGNELQAKVTNGSVTFLIKAESLI